MSLESKASAIAGTGSSPGGREQFYAELEKLQMGPLWEIYQRVLTREPRRREVPYLWPWSKVRPSLLRAGELVSTAEAERLLREAGVQPARERARTDAAAAAVILRAYLDSRRATAER